MSKQEAFHPWGHSPKESRSFFRKNKQNLKKKKEKNKQNLLKKGKNKQNLLKKGSFFRKNKQN